jgi:hypothetical protein
VLVIEPDPIELVPGVGLQARTNGPLAGSALRGRLVLEPLQEVSLGPDRLLGEQSVGGAVREAYGPASIGHEHRLGESIDDRLEPAEDRARRSGIGGRRGPSTACMGLGALLADHRHSIRSAFVTGRQRNAGLLAALSQGHDN